MKHLADLIKELTSVVGAAVDEAREERRLAREQNMKLALAIQADQNRPPVAAGGGAAAVAALSVSAPRVNAVRDVFGLHQ